MDLPSVTSIPTLKLIHFSTKTGMVFSVAQNQDLLQSFQTIGGIFGLGLGQSKQKYSYLPDAHNDFILAILGEELGLIGMIIVIALFAILIWRGIVIATKAPDMFASLLATGITMLIAVQLVLNIAIITSCFPVTGMPVPFMSYGGTSMMIFMASAGILLNISRHLRSEK
jgi:cell division protein FtsW